MAINAQATTPLDLGKEIRVFAETPTAAGSKTTTFAIDAESVLVSLYVISTAGDIDLKVYSVGKKGQEAEIISFPTVSSPTTELLLRKAASTLQKVRIEITYSDTCEFEVRARGVSAGAASVSITGAAGFKVTRTSVTTTAAVLIPASLDDRNGILVENVNDLTSGTEVLYVAETLAKATTSAAKPIRAGGNLAIDLQAGAEIYAVSSSGTIDTAIIESGGE